MRCVSTVYPNRSQETKRSYEIANPTRFPSSETTHRHTSLCRDQGGYTVGGRSGAAPRQMGAAAFKSLEQSSLWHNPGRTQCAKGSKTRRTLLLSLGSISVRQRGRSPVAFRVAAGLVALFTVGPCSQGTPWSRLITASQAIGHSTLSDGSTIDLNVDSELWLTNTPAGPVVRLERGEVFIHTQHARPHSISLVARQWIVRDIGTSFSVRLLDGGGIRVDVEEGVVTVADRRGVVRPLSYPGNSPL